MSLRWGTLLFAAAAFLFWVANRGAYQSYFSGDDLDNLSWTREGPLRVFAEHLVSPLAEKANFRPVGHFVYRVMGGAVGLDYRWYAALLHALHLLNVLLVWRLLRRMGAPVDAAMMGALLFAFHMALFDAFWQFMFVFDVLCGTFLLITLLLYVDGRWLLALVPYWLAFKTKELAVTLPAVLVAYEFFLGGRRWKRVAPFAAIAVMFGAQAGVANRGRDDNYTLRFTAAAFWDCLRFYASKILLLPWVGFLLIPAAWWVRNRRVRFGLVSVFLFLGPLLFLPGRLFGVYLYVPLIGYSVAMAFLSEGVSRRWLGIAALFWIVGNYGVLRMDRRRVLTEALDHRNYVRAAGEFVARQPDVRTFVIDGNPESLHRWGAEAAFRWFHAGRKLTFSGLDEGEIGQVSGEERIAVATWNRRKHELLLLARTPETGDAAYIDMGQAIPYWQLTDGWYGSDAAFRWTKSSAVVRLRVPAGVKALGLTANVSPLQMQDQGKVTVEALVNGASLGTRTYERQGWQEVRWPVPPGLAGTARVEIRNTQPYRPSNGDPRTLGVAVGGIGFIER